MAIQEHEDWDRPFTDQELLAIDAVFESASSSSSSSSKRRISDNDSGNSIDEKTRRTLPESLFTFQPCNSNSFRKNPTYQGNLMMRRPEMAFGGRIVYSRNFEEVEKSAEELLNFVEAKRRTEGKAILGFDIEWRPTFRRGVAPGRTAVMQICGDNNLCYVMHIFHSGIPQNLQCLLENPTSVKVGVCIANDARKVSLDHNVSVQALKDLSDLANQKLGGDCRNWSLSSLTEILICKQLPKPNKIRRGNWEAEVLSKEQLNYAATDAYVSWYLYQALERLPESGEINKAEEPFLR